MTNRVVTPPTSRPVTLAEARVFRNLTAYLGTSPPSHPADPVLELGIDAGREFCEDHCGLSIGLQVREEVLDAFPDFEIALPYGPVHAVESVTYVDAAGAPQTLSEDAYVLDDVSRPAVLLPATGTTWPETQAGAANTVTVTYSAGYTCEGDSPDDSPVPARIRQVVHLFVGHYYENREAVSQGVELKEIPLGVEPLLFQLRRPKVA